MRRALLMLVLLTGALFAPASMAAQTATPEGSPANANGTFDLPALVLTPDELEAAGLSGFGVSFSMLLPDAASYTEEMLDGSSAMAKIQFRFALQEAGFQRGYAYWLGAADADTGEMSRQVLVYLEEYGDPTRAASAYDAVRELLQPVAVADAQVTIGEPAIVTWMGVRPGESTPVDGEGVGIDVEFRAGTLNAGVAIQDFGGNSPAVDDVAVLARLLAEKIDATSPSPTSNLSFQALRVSDAYVTSDHYPRRGGEIVPEFAETAAGMEQRERIFGAARNVYQTRQYVARVDGDFDLAVRMQNWLLQFEDEPAAADYVSGLPAMLASSPGVANVESMSADGGDQAIALTYATAGPDGEEYVSQWTAVRVGNVVTNVVVRNLDVAPDAAAVEALAMAAERCLHSEGWCPPVALPAALGS